MIEALFALSDAVRYVAVYRDGQLEKRSKAGTEGASGTETDRYEELLVNPTVLTLTAQRGNIDCGGLNYVLIRYGNFFQLVVPLQWGHVSVCIEPDSDVLGVTRQVTDFLATE